MTIRLKVERRKEQQINKVKDLMQMFSVPSFPTYQYQPIGGSTSATINPKIEKTRNLFEMFHLVR